MATKSEKKLEQTNVPFVISPLYQLVLILISFACISVALSEQVGIYHFLDPKPNMYTITPQVYAEYGGFASIINVGLEIGDFESFDVTNNSFTFNGVVWFKFTPGVISLDTLELFRFARGEILKKSEPDIQLIDEKILVRYLVKVKFTASLTHTYFPLDDHRVYLMLTHQFVSIGEIVFESNVNDFMTKKNVASVGWNQLNQSVEAGYSQAQISLDDPRTTRTYPVVLFAIEYERYGIRHLLTILLPLLLIFYISFFSLSISRSNVSLSLAAATAIISYRFVIDRMSPDVAYFMYSDYYFFLFLGGVLAVFLLTMANEYSHFLGKWAIKIIIALIHAAVAGCIVYLFLS
jgi:hypothetical protein